MTAKNREVPDKLWDTPPETFEELLKRLNLTYLYQEQELWVGDSMGAVPMSQVRVK